MGTFSIDRAEYTITTTFEEEADVVLWTAGVFHDNSWVVSWHGSIPVGALKDRSAEDAVRNEVNTRMAELPLH